MDDQGSRGPGRPPDDDKIGDGRTQETDQDYYWGGKPGEDFGPISPPEPRPTSGGRPPVPPRAHDEPIRPDPDWPAPDPEWRPPNTRTQRVPGQPLRADGVFTRPVRRRRWRPIFIALSALLVLGGLTGAVLFVIARQGMLGQIPGAELLQPTAAPAPAVTGPATPAPSPSLVTASPVPVASPTPLALGARSPTPLASRPPAASPTTRPSPAILPTPPSLVTPPAGLRFPTSTPARLTTPQLFRTPPPIPSPRLPTISTRVWSEQVIHRVGDDASICGQTASGASAQLLVIAPDRTARTLGEFTTPSERTCYTLRVDQPELWVLTLIIRDTNANEIDRQSAALWVSR